MRDKRRVRKSRQMSIERKGKEREAGNVYGGRKGRKEGRNIKNERKMTTRKNDSECG